MSQSFASVSSPTARMSTKTESGIKRAFFPVRLQIRVSALLIAITQVMVIACSLPVIVWVGRGFISECRTLNFVMFIAMLVLSFLRCSYMLTAAYLTGEAGRAAVDEATIDHPSNAKQRKKGTTNALSRARSRTQLAYDRVLLIQTVVEPVLFLTQLAFIIVHLVKVRSIPIESNRIETDPFMTMHCEVRL